jgi:hypothetical protein
LRKRLSSNTAEHGEKKTKEADAQTQFVWPRQVESPKNNEDGQEHKDLEPATRKMKGLFDVWREWRKRQSQHGRPLPLSMIRPARDLRIGKCSTCEKQTTYFTGDKPLCLKCLNRFARIGIRRATGPST